jgi:hypothetical protein
VPALAPDEIRSIGPDPLAAANLLAGIGSTLITLALGVLAGEIALFTYLSQNYQVGTWFYIVSGVAAFCLIMSMISGGAGIAKTANHVANSDWSTSTPNNKFNYQAYWGVGGLGLIVVAFVIAVNARPTPTPGTQTELLQKQLITLNEQVRGQRRQLTRLEREVKRLSHHR